MERQFPGYLITFEGPDGSGKTSCIQTVAQTLRAAGRVVITTREPGGTPVAEQLREIVLTKPVSGRTEVLIFAAARMDHLETVIYPALRRGDIVLCDRFADSTYAYQGEGRRLLEEVALMEKFVLNGFEPDITLFFDVDFAESERRMAERAKADGVSTLFDQERAEFKQRVYTGYQRRFNENRHRMVWVNAMPPLEEVRAWIAQWVEKQFLSTIQES